MTLAPTLPPGRANRKALQFAVDIVRLRNCGYTFSAIRAALLDAGLSVSLSTVKREVARRGTSTRFAPQMFTPQGDVPKRPTWTAAPRGAGLDALPARLLAPPSPTSRESAEAFFNAHPSNPLVRPQERP